MTDSHAVELQQDRDARGGGGRDCLRYVGAMRVYFNKHADAPRVWCIRAGQWELAVAVVVISGVVVSTTYKPKETDDDDDGVPSAWFDAVGELLVATNGVAHIRPEPAQ